jgi:hypothetical protein
MTEQMTADRYWLEFKLRRLTATPSWPNLYDQGAITPPYGHLMRTAWTGRSSASVEAQLLICPPN